MRLARRRGRVVMSLLLALVAALVPTAVDAATVTDRLPNLVMARPQQFHLETSPNRRLRFSAIIVNAGAGPFEVRGTRKCDGCTRMSTEQYVKRTNGTWRHFPTLAEQRYATSDSHHHWHVIDMESYDLYALDAASTVGPLSGKKEGYCFFDGEHRRPHLPGSPRNPVYSFWGCGFSPNDQKTRVGLAVGWGDIYPWNFAGQFIDVTDVPDGHYLVCITADPKGYFLESDDSDNQSWSKVSLAGDTVTVSSWGRTSCAAELPPPA